MANGEGRVTRMGLRHSLGLLLGAACVAGLAGGVWAAPPERQATIDAMKKATSYMVEKVSVKGGYVWNVAADFSRRWGEMEAYPTMIWMQEPSTPSMGNIYLDAYHATKDEVFYEAAAKTADAMILAQLPSGGWGYLFDTAGEASTKKWFETIGKNGWRLEEFQHYYGNGTFDDSVSTEAGKFMLRISLEKKEPRFVASADKAVKYVLESQYANGGWPQRYPRPAPELVFKKDGLPDYTGFITFNDGVCANNVDFLILVYTITGDKSLLDPIRRGMDIFLATQGKGKQAGWGLQHDPVTLEPMSGRTYEPKAYATHTTGSNIDALLKFYRLTGDKKYLARIPEALDWLDSVRLSQGQGNMRGNAPTFLEVETGKPLYIHRSGSNSESGHYFTDQNPQNVIGHYSSFRNVNVTGQRQQLAQAMAMSAEEATRNSPLLPGVAAKGAGAFAKYVAGQGPGGRRGGRGGGAATAPATGPATGPGELTAQMDPPVGALATTSATGPATESAAGAGPGLGRGRRGGGPFGRVGTIEEQATQIVVALNADGAWITAIGNTSHPYKGDGPKEASAGNFGGGNVGDEFDTSPYPARGADAMQGISTTNFINNMATLIRYLEAKK